MKTFKTITAAATVGLVAFATTTAQAGELSWSGRVDNEWSTPGNWCDTSTGERVEDVPDASTQLYVGLASWNFSYDIVLDKDVEAAAWITYSDRTKTRRFSGGHTLTINGTCQDAPFCSVGVQEISGEGTQVLLTDTRDSFWIFRESGVLVTNRARLVVYGRPLVRTAPSSGSKHTPVKFTAVDGGIFEFAAFSLKKADNGGSKVIQGTELNLKDEGVLKVTGTCSIGEDSNTSTISISGEKTEAGSLQLSGESVSLGSGTTVSLTPKMEWADGSDVGLIAYSGTGTATLNANIAYKVNLAAFQNMAAHTTNTICIFSNPDGSGSTSFTASKLTLTNPGDLTAALRVNGRNLYLDIVRGHVLGEEWNITQMPTKRHKGMKYCRCTGEGCDYVDTHELPQLPGDFLIANGVGYFATTYTPHLKNTRVEFTMVLDPSSVSRCYAWAGSTDPNTAGLCVFDGTWVCYQQSVVGAGDVVGFGEHVVNDGKKLKISYGDDMLSIDGVEYRSGNESKDRYADGMLNILKTNGYQSSPTAKIYSVKVTEKVKGVDVVKMWLVPGMNGTQATFYDLVTESYLTPTSGAGFMIGEDPGGIMMYLR